MILIRKAGTKTNKNGHIDSYGIFWCDYCKSEVEKRLEAGKIAKSCGCNKGNFISESLLGEKRNYKHGGRHTRLYNIWCGIKQRVFYSNHKAYKYYGGRGIPICNEWLEFIPFRDWALNNGYQDNLTIDRKENELGYYPENCQWLTAKDNIRKQKQVKLTLELANEIRELYATGNYTQRELAKLYNVSQKLIYCIINNKIWR